jgi:hypothetical protein
VQSDGTDLTAADKTSVVNLPFDSLFSYITVELENIKLEDTSYCYPYKAMIEKGLSYSGAAKRTHMRSALFEADTPGKFDIILAAGGNKGFDARAKRFAGSKFAHFHFPLALDLSTLSKPLPPSTTLKLIFHRTSDNFTLMGASTHKIEISQLYLEIGKIVLSDSLANSVARKFTTTPFNYDITHTKITKYTIPAGLHDGSKYAVFNKVALPRFIMIGLVRQVIFYYVAAIATTSIASLLLLLLLLLLLVCYCCYCFYFYCYSATVASTTTTTITATSITGLLLLLLLLLLLVCYCCYYLTFQ